MLSISGHSERKADSVAAPDDDLAFASLICSRLCHDLVGPVGAISNGIELIEMEEDLSDAADALDLLKHSAGNAAERLRFLRLAFGSSGGDDTPLPMAEARKAAMAFFGDSRFDLVWPEVQDGNVSKSRVRLALNLLMAGANGLLRGGTLSLDLSSTRLMITGVHERAGLADSAVDAMTSVTEARTGEDARIIECFLAAKLARAEGLKIAVQQDAGRFVMTAG